MADAPFRIQVEDLGRIAQADVTVKPFTLFVGENNSGKSWLATAIWAFHQGTLPMPDEDHPTWREAVDGAGRLLEQAANPAAVRIDAGAWREHARALTPLIYQKTLDLAFRRPTRVGSIDTLRDLPGATLQRSGQDVVLSLMRNAWRRQWTPESLAGSLIAAQMCASPDALLLPNLQWSRSARCGMLPASRTGCMQLLPTVIDAALADHDGPALPGLTGPVQSFLRRMANPPSHELTLPELAERIERDVLGGEVVRKSPGRYTFKPQGTEERLPMAAASGLVTELAPLTVHLRNGVPQFLIYEEPEAHLHPRVQRLVAQVLVRLVRRGVKVLVTTHSTTFAQQVNSFIKLGALDLDDKERAAMADALGLPEPYTDEDRLLPDEVAAYGFRFRDDGRTVVDALEVRDEGVVMPSFNDEAQRIRAEYQWLNDRLDER